MPLACDGRRDLFAAPETGGDAPNGTPTPRLRNRDLREVPSPGLAEGARVEAEVHELPVNFCLGTLGLELLAGGPRYRADVAKSTRSANSRSFSVRAWASCVVRAKITVV